MNRVFIALAVLAAVVSCTVVKTQPAVVTTAGTVPSGCWVRIWEDPNFGGANDTIMGPGRFATMMNLPGATHADWNDKIDSIEVGPATTVIVWQDSDFRSGSLRLVAGERRGSLSGSPKMNDEIGSMEITCP